MSWLPPHQPADLGRAIPAGIKRMAQPHFRGFLLGMAYVHFLIHNVACFCAVRCLSLCLAVNFLLHLLQCLHVRDRLLADYND